MNKTYIYIHNNSLYINLTNSCTNSCDFCIRNQMDGIDGYDLWLSKDPETKDIIESLEEFDVMNYKEIVFCGYGEPTMKLDVLLESAKHIKENYPEMKTRINTNGQANLYHKKDITPLFEGLIDKISISLNAPNSKEYQDICHSGFGEQAFDGILEFSKLAKKHVPNVRLTVIDLIGEEKIARCQSLADENELTLYVRKSI